MGFELNKTGQRYSASLIREGRVDKDSSWDWTLRDESDLLGPDDDDYARYAKVHLAIDPEKNKNTKNAYAFPIGKVDGDDEKIYRSGLEAARKRALQNGYSDIQEGAEALLAEVDKAEDNSTTDDN